MQLGLVILDFSQPILVNRSHSQLGIVNKAICSPSWFHGFLSILDGYKKLLLFIINFNVLLLINSWPGLVSDQGRWIFCPAAVSRACMCGEREEAFLWGLRPLTPVLVAVGIQRAWRQPRRVWPLHVLDIWLKGLATNRVSMLHFESIVLIHFYSIRCLCVLYEYVQYAPKKSRLREKKYAVFQRL